MTSSVGIPQAAPDQSSPNKDAHIWHTCRTTGAARIVDCKGPKQGWQLLHLSGAKNGCVWSAHQRAIGTCLDQYFAEAFCWPN